MLMKKNSLFALLFFIVSTALSAKVITVDNNAGAVAQFNNITDAYAAAEDDDIILLAGSATSYGGINCYKRLQFIGNGYFLANNSTPGLNKATATLNISFKEDVNTGLGDSSNSSVLGLAGVYTSPVSVSGLTIEKCYGTGSWVFDGTVTVTRSFNPGRIYLRESNSSVSNTIVAYLHITEENITATHCVVTVACYNVANTSISSTIFMVTTPGNLETNANITYSINVGPDNIVPDGVGNNTTGQILANVFTLEGGSGAVDKYYQTKEGGAADNTGNNAGTEDMGAFGGAVPYVLSGVPGIPRMTYFAVPSIATGLTPLEFEGSARSIPE